MALTNDNRTLGEMFAELSREIRTLVHQEIQLARTELTEKVSRLGKGVGFVIGGGLRRVWWLAGNRGRHRPRAHRHGTASLGRSAGWRHPCCGGRIPAHSLGPRGPSAGSTDAPADD